MVRDVALVANSTGPSSELVAMRPERAPARHKSRSPEASLGRAVQRFP
ncbi:hypothetical protein I552_3712 [Mycobacterium xenopi 3993]|nr:hypothetical protein I552_3712 [Mycobacterium xenopi 3993]